MTPTLAEVVAPLRCRRFSYSAEDQLQQGVAEALAEAGLDAVREVQLGAAGRIDLMAGRIGIEVKVAGPPGAVVRQLGRYARSGRLDGLVLVTSRILHRPPARLAGIPVATVCTVLGGL